MKIMVCYDSLKLSKTVLREAQKHAEKWNAEMEIITVITRIEPIKHEKLVKMEEQFEHDVKEIFKGKNIKYSTSLLVDYSEAGEKIVNSAKRNNIDLIFLGIKKHSKVGKLLFGSTAQYVILKAPCPVVTINLKN